MHVDLLAILQMSSACRTHVRWWGRGEGSDSVNHGDCSGARTILSSLTCSFLILGCRDRTKQPCPSRPPSPHPQEPPTPDPITKIMWAQPGDVLLRKIHREEPEGTSSSPLCREGLPMKCNGTSRSLLFKITPKAIHIY